jgi:phosphoglycolate phosphatase
MPVAVLFDLDGTLLDTLHDVGNAANRALRRGGFPEHPLAEYRFLLGGGVRRLFAAALPDSARTDDNIRNCIAAFHEEYHAAWNVLTRPYIGIPELINELRRRGIQLAVLSNKPHEFTRQCIQAHFPDTAGMPLSPIGIGPFSVVFGERAGVPPKPNPAGAIEIAPLLGVPAERILYLGDTSIDMQTARGAGMRPVGVLWGFRDREELLGAGAERVIAEPLELLPLITDLGADVESM